ncbi:uncharacterized protein Dwil_GK17623 [Drosophila willistoni]|uniref:Uncharacterized protein n=1 Tax=Drosophila willistoni TaxID=7260 RepID=B4MN20_DROWI|nr:4-nitrophenylphosphatase [Drosophila willistoni]EDW73576.1 uncharacterized protein Dwil_GK17623 [Drosophila willistoni]
MFKQSCSNLIKIPKQRVRQWLNTFDVVLCDADGVLWHLDRPIEGAADTFNLLSASGKQTFLVTNDSSMLAADLSRKANKFGIVAQEHEVLSSSLSIANFLSAKNFQKKAYVVGERGIVQELAKIGICAFSSDDKKSVKSHITMQEFASKVKLDANVGAVIVGKDEEFTVPKIIRASSYLRNDNVLFLGTCLDAAYPVGEKRLIVGAGAMVAAIKALTFRKPLILGKPNPWMVAHLQQRGVIKPETTLMIGDTLSTDIIFAHNCGFQSLFVGTGVNTLKDVQKICEDGDEKKLIMIPDTYLPSLADLQEFLC